MRIGCTFSIPLAMFLFGCSKAPASDAAPRGSAPAPVAESGEQAPAAATSAAPAPTPAGSVDAPELRRGYAAADMRTDGCAKVEDDGVIHGRKCATVFAVFGPYVKVPAKSQVEVSFQVEVPSQVTVVSDMVSELGRKFHGSIVEEHVGGKEPRNISYRVAFPDATEALEARIGLHAEGPVDFQIKNLVVSVH